MGDDTIYLKLLLQFVAVRWDKLPWCWQLKDKKNSLLTNNNYLLKQTPIQDSTIQPRRNQRKRRKFKRLCVTIVFVYIYPLNGDRELNSYEEPIYIYIYIYIYIVAFCRIWEQTNEVSKRCRFYRLISFSESEAFAVEALVLQKISFLIFLYSVWTSDIFSLLTLKTSIFTEDFPGNKHFWLANQSQIISYSSITFLLVNQSNTLIYICRENIAFSYLILIGHPIKPQFKSLVNQGP